MDGRRSSSCRSANSSATDLLLDPPGYVKIAWNLSVEAIGPATSVFCTGTRVATTDSHARTRFRRYWALFSPGILLIHREGLRIVRAEAERRYRTRDGASRR